MDGLLIQRESIYQYGREKHHPILCIDGNKSSIFGMKEITKQQSHIHLKNSQHPKEQKESRTLMQAIEDVLRKNGLEPKWDYSKAGQSVIIPTLR